VQGYEIQADTLKMVLRTLKSEFGKVEAWSTLESDLLFVATQDDRPWSVKLLNERIAQEPFAQAVQKLWHTDTVEGVVAHLVANQEGVQKFANEAEGVNTDDRNLLEFGFARSFGQRTTFGCRQLRQVAQQRGQYLPALRDGGVRDDLYLMERLQMGYDISTTDGSQPWPLSESVVKQLNARRAFQQKDWSALVSFLPAEPSLLGHKLWKATALAYLHKTEAEAAIQALGPYFTSDAAVLRAIASRGRGPAEEARFIVEALQSQRLNPWLELAPVVDVLSQAVELATKHPGQLRLIHAALSAPLGAYLHDHERLCKLAQLSEKLEPAAQIAVVDQFGPHYPWEGHLLAFRFRAFLAADDPRQGLAFAEMMRFVEQGGELPKPAAKAEAQQAGAE
jgi:spermidine synthase